jgi:galactose mutarotase-like enzyme
MDNIEDAKCLDLFGKSRSPAEIMQKVGNMDRIAGARSYIFNDGRARGVRAFDVRNGSGLNFTVLVDRGMDIAYAEYHGIPFAWMSDAGVVAPEYHERSGRSFNRTFTGGLLTTCGLTQAGEPGVDQDGEELGLHGRISHTPAENASAESEWVNGDYITRVSGTLRERNHGSYCLTLKRRIETALSKPGLSVSDTVTNTGFIPAPLMLIHHINFGFPFVDEHTRLFSDALSVRPVYDTTGRAYDDMRLLGPSEEKQMHMLEMERGRKVCAGLFNPEIGLGARICFSTEQLPFCMQWKFLRYGYNAVAIEPANCYAWKGRAESRRDGELPVIAPGESHTFQYSIELITQMPL